MVKGFSKLTQLPLYPSSSSVGPPSHWLSFVQPPLFVPLFLWGFYGTQDVGSFRLVFNSHYVDYLCWWPPAAWRNWARLFLILKSKILEYNPIWLLADLNKISSYFISFLVISPMTSVAKSNRHKMLGIRFLDSKGSHERSKTYAVLSQNCVCRDLPPFFGIISFDFQVDLSLLVNHQNLLVFKTNWQCQNFVSAWSSYPSLLRLFRMCWIPR